MLNRSGITKTTLTAPNQILGNVELQSSVGIVVSKDCTSYVTEGGKKILKAGTPLTGDLDARTTAFTNAATAEGVSNAVGVLLHDVDITSTTANVNGTLLIFGFVDTNKVHATPAALITAEVKTALPGVRFIAY